MTLGNTVGNKKFEDTEVTGDHFNSKERIRKGRELLNFNPWGVGSGSCGLPLNRPGPVFVVAFFELGALQRKNIRRHPSESSPGGRASVAFFLFFGWPLQRRTNIRPISGLGRLFLSARPLPVRPMRPTLWPPRTLKEIWRSTSATAGGRIPKTGAALHVLVLVAPSVVDVQKILGLTSISILNPGIRIFLENHQKPCKNGWFLKRTMAEQNGKGIKP